MKLFGKATLLMLFLAAPSALAGRSDFDIKSIPPLNLGTWENAGSISGSTATCIESYDGRNEENYRFEVTDLLGDNGFYLYKDGNGNSTGSDRIFISMFERDTESSPSFSEIEYEERVDRREGTRKNRCPAGGNGVFRVDISGSELAGASAGDYIGRFRVEGEGGDDYDDDDDEDLYVYLTVAQSQPEVKISRMDDIAAVRSATHAGNLSADEYFCVYADSGDYAISVSSSVNQGGSFAIQSSNGSLIPIDLAFADNTSGAGLQNAESGSVTGTGNAVAADCGGTDNAMIRVTASDAALSAASSGSYTATLTLFVEPI